MNPALASSGPPQFTTEPFSVTVEWQKVELEIYKEHADYLGDVHPRLQEDLGGEVHCWAKKAAGEIINANEEKRPVNFSEPSVEMIVRDSKAWVDLEDDEHAPIILRLCASEWREVVAIASWLNVPVHGLVRAALWHTFWKWKDREKVYERTRKAQETRMRNKAKAAKAQVLDRRNAKGKGEA